MRIKELEKYIIKDKIEDFRGRQVIYRFPNNYGASVVNGKILHSYSFYIELAVIQFIDDDFELVYDTGITNDVEILNNDKELKKILFRIKRLKEEK